jgi:beta-mannosidase
MHVFRSNPVLVLLALSLFLFTCTPQEEGLRNPQQLLLNRNWQFRQAGTATWYKAQVPGSVHADLLENHLIDNPLKGQQSFNLQWIEQEDWEYRSFFEVPTSVYTQSHQELVLEGLDTYAHVYLNDSLVHKADNMFEVHRISCKGILRPGRNQLKIYFRSPILKSLSNLPDTALFLPSLSEDSRLKTAHLVRKASYQFGVGTGPRFVGFGIWKPIRLEAWSKAHLVNADFFQQSLDSANALLNAAFDLEADEPYRALVRVRSPQNLFPPVEQMVNLSKGNKRISLPLSIPSPQLWHIHQEGKPFLYQAFAELYLLENKSYLADTLRMKLGLRKFSLKTRTDSAGESMQFLLNGKAIFVKGATWLPPDPFPGRVSAERYRQLLESVKRAGINLLRVWAGGIYEQDAFYEACDQLGIMVWQDLPFYNTLSLAPGQTLKDIEKEVTDNVKRISKHPSLVLWCGGDRILESWYERDKKKYPFSNKDSLQLWKGYEDLFLKTLPRLIRQYDDRNFLLHSPRYYKLPQAGDSQWEFIPGKPLVLHPKARFISKFGFPSYPAWSTTYYFARDIQSLKPGSLVMKSHFASASSPELLNPYLEQYLIAPKNFTSLLYQSEWLQAKVIKEGIEQARMQQAYCQGIIAWHFNDTWPGISASLLDYFDNRKAAYYALSRAYSPVITAFEPVPDKVRLGLVSETKQAVRIQVELRDTDGRQELLFSDSILLAPGLPVYPVSWPVRSLLLGRNLTTAYLYASIQVEGQLTGENLYFFVSPRQFRLPSNPALVPEVVAQPAEGRIQVKVSCFRLALGVQLETGRIRGYWSDNYFDLVPGMEKVCYFYPQQPVSESFFKEQLNITSLVDSYEAPSLAYKSRRRR